MDITATHKAKRFNLLLALYIASEADYDFAINILQLAEQRGYTEKEAMRAFKYLMEERFVEPRDGGSEYLAAITHKGIKVIEEVFLDPQKQTYYFPPTAKSAPSTRGKKDVRR